MIEGFLLSLYFTFVNPADPTGKTMYPSGVGDLEYQYFDGLPDTENPNLVLSAPIMDMDKKIISPGIYEISYSKENNQILFIQNKEIKAKLEVSQVVSLSKEYTIPTATARILNPKQVMIMYRNKNIEVYCTPIIP